ncbi:protein RDM1-like [Apium graveolens]|uniref:protein RDM1-like n=1 Tax=Apium graveolens TaxID=4045 RepID=UPI003D7A0D6D
MKRAMPFDDQVDISSDEESSSELDIAELAHKLAGDVSIDQPEPTDVVMTIENVVLREAEMYQDFMMHLTIPTQRGAIVPFSSWREFGNSMKEIYKQPLHYLTNVFLRQLDQNRIGADDVDKRLDTIIHPAKAEVFLWMTEEIHRLTTSPHQLATLWLNNPMYKAFIDLYAPLSRNPI